MQVQLGVLLENENSNDGMLNIMHYFHQYVPMIEETKNVYIPIIDKFADICLAKFHKLLIGGDQLTGLEMLKNID